MNFLERQNNTQNVFLSEEAMDITDILKSRYGYIYDSMAREGFILKYDTCNLFKELICDSKVVGFCSYDFSREFMTVALNNIYILPDFRRNGIFLRELERTMAEHNKPSIMEPTRLVVEILIKYGFAKKISGGIVASAIEFIVPGSHVLSNGEYGDEELSTHFYDLEMCASIHILDIAESRIAYSGPLNYDIMHYDCIENRSGMNEDYFKGICELFKSSEVEFMEILLNLEEALPIRDYTLEEVIGPEGEFSPYIESLIDDGHVTRSDAFEIKTQIREEYESGMILNESLLVRLAYLFDKNTEPRIQSHDDTCPYCGMPVDSHDRFCHFCGINLDYDADGMEKSLLNSINTSKSRSREDIRYVAYKFLMMVDGKIDLEYAIFSLEATYGIEWHALELFLEKNAYFADGAVTPEGYAFLRSHPLHFFESYGMEIVDYTDFESYFYENTDVAPHERCLNYLKSFDDDGHVRQVIDEILRDFSS